MNWMAQIALPEIEKNIWVYEDLTWVGLSRSESLKISQQTQLFETLAFKTAEQLQEDSKVWSLVYRVGEEIVGFICMSEFDYQWVTIYKRWTLRVDPIFSGYGIAKKLMQQITEKFQDQPVFSLTKSPASIALNRKPEMGMMEYAWEAIGGTDLAYVLWKWDQLSSYTVFMNQVMRGLYKNLC